MFMNMKYLDYLDPMVPEKTSTLEIIETLRDKTSGEVLVNGMSIDTQPQEIKKK